MTPPSLDDLLFETVVFAAGRGRFAIAAAKVAALEPADTATDAPRIERSLGLPVTKSGQTRTLRLRAGGRRYAVRHPVELKKLPGRHLYPLPPLAAARLQIYGVKALGLDEAGAILIVDPDLWPDLGPDIPSTDDIPEGS